MAIPLGQPTPARGKDDTVQNLHLLVCESRAREKRVLDEKRESAEGPLCTVKPGGTSTRVAEKILIFPNSRFLPP